MTEYNKNIYKNIKQVKYSQIIHKQCIPKSFESIHTSNFFGYSFSYKHWLKELTFPFCFKA